MNIAYYFDFDYADGRAADSHARDALALVREWMGDADRGSLELRTIDDGAIELLDTRPRLAAAPRRARLRGWKAAVYLACDRAQPFQNLTQLLEVQVESVADAEVRAFLDRCVEHRLMVHNGRSWLGVAVHVPARRGSDDAGAAEPVATVAVGQLSA